ncbi:MAG: hypothetical protein Q9174_005891, partial [Haloplaca sp. 1 TL-2023]
QKVDQSRVNIESKDFLVPKNLPKRIRAQIERTKLIPRGYAVIEDPETHSEVLVREDFLRLKDRYFSRGDVVKRRPSDAESGTTIANSVICTLQPCMHVSYGAELQSQVFEVPAGLTGEIPRIDSRRLLPYQPWGKGESAFRQDWVGSIVECIQQITLLLENGCIIKVKSVDGIRARVRDPLDAESPFVPMQATTRDIKAGCRWIHTEDLFPGQKVLISKKAFWEGHIICGTPDISCRRGMVLSVSHCPVHVDWMFPKASVPDTDFRPPAFDFDNTGAVRPYNRSRGVERSDLLNPDPPYEVVHHGMAIGEIVVITEPSLVQMVQRAYKWQHINVPIHVPEGGGFGSDFVVAKIIDTSSRATVRWQDNHTTHESGTSICPYTEVDEYDVWPGELVSLKEQEETEQSPGYEAFVRTRMVGVVQSVDAAERVAYVRWFEGTDVTISGAFAESIVWPHSTLGTLGSRKTENSVYEIAGHWAMVKRRGDTVRIHNTSRLFFAETMPGEDRAIPTNTPFVRPHDDAIDWFGEIMDLTFDGRVVVRLGALDRVQDVICEYRNITVTTSADDDTTDTDSGNSSQTDETLGLMGNQLPTQEKTTIEYDGPIPSEADDQQWDTESETTEALFKPRKLRPDELVSTGTTENENVEDFGMSSSPTHSDNDDTITGLASPTSGPASFAILDGSSPEIRFDRSGDGMPRPKTWHRAVHREHKILRSSLPEGVYARTWEESMELIRVLIVGPSGTPYALAPFVFDIKMHNMFPVEPPKAFFHSWTNGIGRVNPNLYEDGKVCLSLLGTWTAAEDSEAWVMGKSSILQVILSLLGLVLVKEPFYNEAGFEALQGGTKSQHQSDLYSEKALVLSRGFAKSALDYRLQGLED